MSGHVSIPYVRSFDGLRALAVCAVVAFHCNVFRGGWLGVDLFFVLSGYLITSIIVAEVQATGALSLRRFWARRAKRLLPAVGVLLAFVVLLRAMHQVQIRSRGVWGAVTYSTNWVQLHAKQGYWDAFATRDPLSHLWSLAVEEQFYLGGR